MAAVGSLAVRAVMVAGFRFAAAFVDINAVIELLLVSGVALASERSKIVDAFGVRVARIFFSALVNIVTHVA